MGTKGTKITLQPGGSITVPPTEDPVEVEAGPCPGEKPPDDWVLPKSMIAFRIDDQIVGGLPTDRISSVLEETIEPPGPWAERTLAEYGIEVVGVLPWEEAASRLAPLDPDERLAVVLPTQDLSVDAYETMVRAVRERGGDVEFMVIPPAHA
jgi:hypothetical protein